MTDRAQELAFLQNFLDEEIFHVKERNTTEPVLSDDLDEPTTSSDESLKYEYLTKPVLVAYSTNGRLSDEEKTLLNNILASIQLKPDNIDNVELEEISNADWSVDLVAKIILVFSDNNIPTLGVERYSSDQWNNRHIILADSLEALQKHREKRSQLWQSLKVVFDI